MERFSAGEIIEQAVQTERLGYDLYSSMAKKFEKDSKLSALMQFLAVKEQAHERTFAELKTKVKDAEPENPGEVSKYLRALVESEFFLGSDKSLSGLENVRTSAEALKFALGFEKETLLYFYAIRNVISEQDIIDPIIDEEKKHIIQLNEYKRSISGS